MLAKMCKRAGVERKSNHSQRATRATEMFAANVPEKLIQKDYSVFLNQLDGNVASDISTRCSGHPPIPLRTTRASGRKLSSHQVDSRESVIFLRLQNQ